MFIIGYFLTAAANIINWVLVLFIWIVVARAVLSWVSPDPYNPIVRFIYNVTEPVLYRVRSLIPTNFGGIDFSPIVAIMAAYFLQVFLVNSLLGIAQRIL